MWGLSPIAFQLSFSTGFTLQVRHTANAQVVTGLFTSIRQPVNIGFLTAIEVRTALFYSSLRRTKQSSFNQLASKAAQATTNRTRE